MKFGFFDRFSKKSQISSFIKIRPVRTELFVADRQTGMTKLIVVFRNFANAPENGEIAFVGWGKRVLTDKYKKRRKVG
jgi:hypothetical protein